MTSPDRPGKKRVTGRVRSPIKSEGAKLWHEVTNSVTPLTLKKIHNPTRSTKNPSPEIKSKEKQFNDLPTTTFTGGEPVKPNFQHGKAPGLDRKTQTRMRRGQVQVERRLDLHGMIQTEAHHALLNFIEAAYVEGRRSVLVITGKGLTRDGEIGVLRRAVPRWLNEPPMNAWIKGFDHAARQHGGEGALYVLIRRKR